MINQPDVSTRMRQLALVAMAAGVMVTVSLVVLQLSAEARFRAGGAKGCGTFINAVNQAEDGDTIVQMIPLKTTDGAVISKNIAVQGGWFPTANCAEENQVFTETGDLFAGGFEFQAPQTRSILVYDQGPVLTIDPVVVSVTVQHFDLRQLSITTTLGGAISGVITGGAEVRLENLLISDSTVISGGGGIYFEVRGGSRLVISDSQLIASQVSQGSGGGFEIWVYDQSEVIIHNTQVSSNSVSGTGGGGRIIVESGSVTVTNSSFFGNQASTQRGAAAGSGDDLVIESLAAGPVRLWLNDNTFAKEPNLIGNGFSPGGNNFPRTYLPVVINNYPPTTKFVQITDVRVSGSNYTVYFQPFNYAPVLPGEHIHFFFNTVDPQYAGNQPDGSPCTPPGGSSGQCKWKIYPSTNGGSAASPYTGYALAERPAGATQMCALVANPNHSIQPNSGTCYNLP